MILCILLISISNTIYSQSKEPYKINTIVNLAPHLPKMLRYDGSDKAFYGVKHTYKSGQNENNLKEWIKKYPEEAEKYKAEAAKFFESMTEETLSGVEKELYCDLKSQWLMFSQLDIR